MNVETFMTPDPIAIPPDATIDNALRMMDDAFIRHLPVVDGERLVGLVSDRDLITATGWRIVGGPSKHKGSEPVQTVMQTNLVTVSPDEQAVAAAVEVIVRGIGCVPVVDRGKLVGIVTEMDLLELYARVCRENKLGLADDPPVEKVMVLDAMTVAPNAKVSLADELCHAKGFRHLPVVDASDTLIGILSDRDLRRGAGAGLAAEATIEGLMTRRVVTIAPDAALSAAAEQMVEHKVSALPVVGGASMGIVTSSDVIDLATAVLRVHEGAET
ncbi:MAG: CBS domain-containing protein [bacterium]|nr:CBS domain-containing protein [bacterium]